MSSRSALPRRARPGRPRPAPRRRRVPGLSRACARWSTSPSGTGSSSSGSSVTLFMLLFGIVGAVPRPHPPLEYGGSCPLAPTTKDGYWFGTTLLGQDVFAQFATGVRLRVHRRRARRRDRGGRGHGRGLHGRLRSGIVDEVLNMLTNVVLVIPTFAVLLVIAAYLKVRGIMTESLVHRADLLAVGRRAPCALRRFSLVSRDFVDMARLSGRRAGRSSSWRSRRHELVPVHDVHPLVRRLDPDRGHARLHRPRPSNTISLDDDAALRAERALQLPSLVVVLPPGSRRSWPSSEPLRHERRPRRGFNPKLRSLVSLRSRTSRSTTARSPATCRRWTA